MAPRRNLIGAVGDMPLQMVEGASAQRCCIPTGDCLRPIELISPDDPRDSIRVTCNNEACPTGKYMHRECFDMWEQGVLTYLKSCGRARSWSERQRLQNLWTKKGYDLAFKACGCLCGRGHLKKDLDWSPRAEDPEKRRRRRARQGAPRSAAPPAPEPRARAESLSSSGSCSPSSTGSPTHPQAKKNAKLDFFSDRVRAGSGANGIFARRQDFSSFNLLPKHKLNSYHIKMEDEGNHGNDDTRCFILSTLAGQHKSRVTCALCEESMFVFDRYPLVDGTFFLSPRQHTKDSVEVKVDGRTQFLTCVCMGCLERCPPERAIRCRFCGQRWDGSSLVLGTMYSYDIFMASPCCIERLKCNNCCKPLLYPQQRLNYFSDYSHIVSCPHCRAADTHFVKPLAYCFTKQPFPAYQQWP